MKAKFLGSVALVSFEVGVIRGYENVRSAHIQLLYSLATRLAKRGLKVTILTNKLRENTYIPEDIRKLVEIKYISDPRKRKSTNVMHSGFSKKISLSGLIKSIVETFSFALMNNIRVIHYVNGGIEIGLYSSVIRILGLSWFKVFWTPSIGECKTNLVKRRFIGLLNGIFASTNYQYLGFSKYFKNVRLIKHGLSRKLTKNFTGTKNRVTFWRDPSYENGADIAYKVFSRLSKKFPEFKFTILVRPYFDSVIEIDNERCTENFEIYEYPYPDHISLESVLSETFLCYFPFRELSTNPQLCVLESVEAGIPCLVPRLESLEEYVLEEEYLIDYNDQNSAVSKIEKLLEGRDKIRKPTQPSSNGFNWDNFVPEHIDAYNSSF